MRLVLDLELESVSTHITSELWRFIRMDFWDMRKKLMGQREGHRTVGTTSDRVVLQHMNQQLFLWNKSLICGILGQENLTLPQISHCCSIPSSSAGGSLELLIWKRPCSRSCVSLLSDCLNLGCFIPFLVNLQTAQCMYMSLACFLVCVSKSATSANGSPQSAHASARST